MKARDLMKLLLDVKPDDEIYLSQDPEGNGYGPLSNEVSIYRKDKVVILWPTTNNMEIDEFAPSALEEE